MYNILYYDLENFDLDEVKVIIASLKEQLPETMSKKINCSSKRNRANKLL